MNAKQVFINYRRDDAAVLADTLYIRLRERFGDVVFKDVEAIPAGQDFRRYIKGVMETIGGHARPRRWWSLLLIARTAGVAMVLAVLE